ncbi:MAG TPA: hypothetical protein VM144_04840 [Aestuariivirga sp.]|nr:hypothetical protein [Aestuariivirga sp.]
MNLFLRIMQPERGAKILDVGGLPSLNGVPGFWDQCKGDYDITLINLPGAFASFSSRELAPYRLIEADVCEYVSNEVYDIAFSNSVVEHVGSRNRQESFAQFVRSAGRRYWVQTPSPLFPLEAHCNLPFWWMRSHSYRLSKIKTWKFSGNPELAAQMSGTRPITRTLLHTLFPGCAILTERVLGFSKSYIALTSSNQARQN